MTYSPQNDLNINPSYLVQDEENLLALFYIGLNVGQNFRVREVYNLFDWLGDIGGFQQVVFILSSLISSSFSSTLVTILKAESIYKYLPSGRRPQENSVSLRSADELKLEEFSKLTTGRFSCLQKFLLIFCRSKCCKTRRLIRLR